MADTEARDTTVGTAGFVHLHPSKWRQLPAPAQPPCASDAPLPLAGLRVLELGVGIAIPETGEYLGDFGAEVWKVESSQALDFLRAHSGGTPETVNCTPAFNTVNRNKRSLALDLRQPAAQALVRRLATLCDVVLENRPAGTLERWGLAPADFLAVRPDLIIVRSQGYGATGPYRDYVAVGPNVHAFSGLTRLWNHPAPDRLLGGQLNHPDHIASKIAFWAVLAALARRDRTGAGALIEISQAEVAAALMGELFLEALVNGRDVAPIGNQRLGYAPRGAYRCRDEDVPAGNDRWIALAVRTEAEWEGLRRALGDPEWARDPALRTLLTRRRRRAELDVHLREWAAGQLAREAERRLRAEGVPAAVCQSIPEVLADPALTARGAFVVIDHPNVGRRLYLGQPIRAATLGVRFHPPPRLGEDGLAACMTLLGLPPETVAELQATGALEPPVLGGSHEQVQGDAASR